jgi:hypothetical protein
MNDFETVLSQSDRAHLAAASREPQVYAALLRHLVEVQASARALSRWETKTPAASSLAATLPKPRAAQGAAVRND